MECHGLYRPTFWPTFWPSLLTPTLTTSPLHHFTTSPLHHLTTSPPHHLTTSPAHQLTSSPAHQLTISHQMIFEFLFFSFLCFTNILYTYNTSTPLLPEHPHEYHTNDEIESKISKQNPEISPSILDIPF